MKHFIAITLGILTIILLNISCWRRTLKEEQIRLDTITQDTSSSHNQYQLFFIRHIDILYNDTLYSVCYHSPEGDTIRTKLALTYYDPDTTIWVNFYLRNNGDTIIFDNHSDLFLDSLPDEYEYLNRIQNHSETVMDSIFQDSITNKERSVIDEVQQYLKDFQLVRATKEIR